MNGENRRRSLAIAGKSYLHFTPAAKERIFRLYRPKDLTSNISSISMIMMVKTLAIVAILLLSITTIFSAPLVSIQKLRNLKSDPTESQRLSDLGTGPDVYKFDFTSTNGVVAGPGGKAIQASIDDFPALTAQGTALIVGFLKPCGFILPHVHPRATSMFVVTQGDNVRTGFYNEHTGKFVVTPLKQYQGTVFPQGALHFEQNLSCKQAVFVAGFNSVDPGLNSGSSTFFQLPIDLIAASLNITTAQATSLRDHLPAAPLQTVASCRARCGLSD
ncbi:unnamed protein product [Didymodactylos carnosus]|uniref:Cupin type-1 domain-containing protein n=1 Tax=Didymodactylos carnosus TaxID=1234261 RepID=A0A815LD24_9BILA|nr:unnamed protein product [Didymodactylos carnosus]CAF1408330.1 unnamed protein product [Didymodactylos carnosus]CAF4096746.1 unnamed protein product [Didymodactylos carnosus]CAF4298385.1 unnamed protein product [Didymodactylos carnosus]